MENITPLTQALELIPKELSPGMMGDVDQLLELAGRIHTLRKQSILVAIMEWADENQETGILFKVDEDNEQLYLIEDSLDGDEGADEKVEELIDKLNGYYPCDLGEFTDNLKDKLNEVRWRYPDSISVLKKAAKKLGMEKDGAMLENFRSHEMRENLDKATGAASPSKAKKPGRL